MTEILEMGKISSRGQIAIPADIRNQMHLEEGSKVIFFLEDDTLLIKKVNTQTWEDVTRPLRLAKKKINENDVDELVHRLRKK
ncbi:MAG: AbrB/MazE/SpoVT family DNA-binding domain-containing protein [Candidatus Micrarchaeota archaeon]